jgi:uncharacterized protein (TIGR00730 family)
MDNEPRTTRRVCVFCGVRPGARAEYLDVAREFGTLLAARGVGLVYGGSGIGIMGAVSGAAERGGAPVTGVIPRHLFDRERTTIRVADLRVVNSMHDRKSLMYELADGFVALPGGIGTLDELFEIITWAQLGLHTKPTVVLNHGGYYNPLVVLLDHAVAEGFLLPAERALVQVATTAEEALDLLGVADPLVTV